MSTETRIQSAVNQIHLIYLIRLVLYQSIPKDHVKFKTLKILKKLLCVVKQVRNARLWVVFHTGQIEDKKTKVHLPPRKWLSRFIYNKRKLRSAVQDDHLSITLISQILLQWRSIGICSISFPWVGAEEEAIQLTVVQLPIVGGTVSNGINGFQFRLCVPDSCPSI